MESTSSLVYCIPEGKVKAKYVTLVPTDLGSRYKTRQLQVQIQGKSKMIKTVLTNILDVAKDCQIPATYPGCYFGYNIGAQPHFDTKKPERQQAYLSGEHDTKILSKLFESFITEVLLCPNCGLPEISLTVDKKEVMGNCRACGATSKLNIPNQKFKNYVLNHPPAAAGATFTANKAIKEQANKKGKKDSDEEENGENDEEREETPAEIEKKVLEQTEKLNISKKGEEVEWFSDTSEEARRKRREAMLPDAMIESKKDKNAEVKKLVSEATIDAAKLADLKKELALDHQQFMSVFCKELFAVSAPNEALVKKHADLFGKFAVNKDARIEVLKSLESYALNEEKKVLLPRISKVVHAFYDGQVVDEESIRKWVEGANESIKTPMAVLIKWLDEAEEEDDEEDEE